MEKEKPSKPFWRRLLIVEEDDPTPAAGKAPPVIDLQPPEPPPRPRRGTTTPPASAQLDVAPSALQEEVGPTRSALDWTLEEVFKAGGAEPGRNSAETVLKLREGLMKLPRDQQLAMIRVMDQADDTWDEAHVLADAQKRIAILKRFLDFIDRDVEAQITRATQAQTNICNEAAAEVAELDAQIKALQQRRAEKIQVIEQAKADAEQQARMVQGRADRVRQQVDAASARYKELMGFLGVLS